MNSKDAMKYSISLMQKISSNVNVDISFYLKFLNND